MNASLAREHALIRVCIASQRAKFGYSSSKTEKKISSKYLRKSFWNFLLCQIFPIYKLPKVFPKFSELNVGIVFLKIEKNVIQIFLQKLFSEFLTVSNFSNIFQQYSQGFQKINFFLNFLKIQKIFKNCWNFRFICTKFPKIFLAILFPKF